MGRKGFDKQIMEGNNLLKKYTTLSPNTFSQVASSLFVANSHGSLGVQSSSIVTLKQLFYIK